MRLSIIALLIVVCFMTVIIECIGLNHYYIQSHEEVHAKNCRDNGNIAEINYDKIDGIIVGGEVICTGPNLEAVAIAGANEDIIGYPALIIGFFCALFTLTCWVFMIGVFIVIARNNQK